MSVPLTSNNTVEYVAKDLAAVPTVPKESSAEMQTRDVFFWPSLLMAAAMSSIAIGIVWDISWHETVGRDTFWTAAHLAIYLGGVLGGSVGGWLAIKHTFFAGQAERDASVGVFGARAPLGAWVAIWGALAMITSAPFDNWWHNAYGLDVKILSPPHAVLGAGMLGISLGALLLVVARQNRSPATAPKGSGLFIYTGGVFLLLGSVFILEYIFPNAQHAGLFYKACAVMFPSRLIVMACAARVSWPATRTAAVYMGFLCVLDWILALFPAQPRLAPIFNAVTHMVPLPFPLLLIFPAIAIDLVLRRVGDADGRLERIGLAVVLGGIFLAVFLPVQWFFADFLISPRAENWFFMGNRVWGYNVPAGEWQTRFWQIDNDPVSTSAIAISWVIAGISSWIGLFLGRWMRKVRR